MILSHPDMGERYFTFQLAGFTSDNFGYVGQRTTGTAAGDFAIVGPGWHGDLPPGVRRVGAGSDAVGAGAGPHRGHRDRGPAGGAGLQQQYRLTPLSLWGVAGAVVPDRRDVYAPAPASDPLGPWKTLNAMLAENPPPPHHGAGAGPVPGHRHRRRAWMSRRSPPSSRRRLARAAVAGMALLRQQFVSGDWAKQVDGWRYPPPEEGRFGDDFLRRAADQCLAGIAANDPAESVYLLNFQDADGAPFAPQGRYQLHFHADELPPVEAFWSLAAYTSEDLNLIPNPADRYSVGDHAAHLTRDDDGGLTLYLQPEAPGGCRGRELAADLGTAPVVPDPADVPARPHGPRRVLAVSGGQPSGRERPCFDRREEVAR